MRIGHFIRLYSTVKYKKRGMCNSTTSNYFSIRGTEGGMTSGNIKKYQDE